MLRIFRNPILGERIIRKTFSFSAVAAKRFVIKDHYEFDQKVNARTGITRGAEVKGKPTKPVRRSTETIAISFHVPSIYR